MSDFSQLISTYGSNTKKKSLRDLSLILNGSLNDFLEKNEKYGKLKKMNIRTKKNSIVVNKHICYKIPTRKIKLLATKDNKSVKVSIDTKSEEKVLDKITAIEDDINTLKSKSSFGKTEDSLNEHNAFVFSIGNKIYELLQEYKNLVDLANLTHQEKENLLQIVVKENLLTGNRPNSNESNNIGVINTASNSPSAFSLTLNSDLKKEEKDNQVSHDECSKTNSNVPGPTHRSTIPGLANYSNGPSPNIPYSNFPNSLVIAQKPIIPSNNSKIFEAGTNFAHDSAKTVLELSSSKTNISPETDKNQINTPFKKLIEIHNKLNQNKKGYETQPLTNSGKTNVKTDPNLELTTKPKTTKRPPPLRMINTKDFLAQLNEKNFPNRQKEFLNRITEVFKKKEKILDDGSPVDFIKVLKKRFADEKFSVSGSAHLIFNRVDDNFVEGWRLYLKKLVKTKMLAIIDDDGFETFKFAKK